MATPYWLLTGLVLLAMTTTSQSECGDRGCRPRVVVLDALSSEKPTAGQLGARTMAFTAQPCQTNATAAAPSSASGIAVRRCGGQCTRSHLQCRPTRTRVRSFKVALALPEAWVEPSWSQQQWAREGDEEGPRAAPDSRKKARWSPSVASVSVQVEDHLQCECTSSIAKQQQRSPPRRRRRRSGASSLSSSPRQPASATTKLASSSTSSSGSTTESSVNSSRMIQNANLTLFSHDNYYQTCLACKAQAEICEADGQIYDHNMCHCVYPASRTFLNSFYTLGVVMLTVMVCCFLVFGVQKGDENVLNSSRRNSSSRRQRSDSGGQLTMSPGTNHHNHDDHLGLTTRRSCGFRPEDLAEERELLSPFASVYAHTHPQGHSQGCNRSRGSGAQGPNAIVQEQRGQGAHVGAAVGNSVATVGVQGATSTGHQCSHKTERC